MTESSTIFGYPAETVVQLANIGCGAICVLGVLGSFTLISKASTETPRWVPDLIKRFMQMCISLAVVSAGASFYLARNNAGKVQVAREQTETVQKEAEQHLVQSQQAIAEIQKEVTRASIPEALKQQLNAATTTHARRLSEGLKKFENMASLNGVPKKDDGA
ncbi:hypothetical protein [Prosthecobacter sp.]|uniref:hypothetical protein n=1 Tax=Prosthecobacter sp. TaxID=1965333 RepID=UPI003784BC05